MRLGLQAAGLALGVGVWATASLAQQGAIQQAPLAPPRPSAQGTAPAAPPGQPQAQAQKKQSTAPASEPRGGDPVRGRLEQLEEQVIDLQVAIGTLESLARAPGAGGGAAAAGGLRTAPTIGAGGDPARVESLEVQVRALVAQVERMAERIAALEGGGGRPVGAPPTAAPPMSAPLPPPTARTAPARPAPAEVGGFGQTVVTPGGAAGGDAIGSLLRENDPPAPGRQASLVEGNPKQMYETAYGYLLQQDYGAAEAAFTEFLGQFPNDQLAGNAQYWLGETFFVRGQYKSAASAFLKGYQTYARSSKAPDSLLKLAMSLDRLGQKDAACTSFGELQTRFPQAPQQIRSRAQSERQRLGC